MSSPSDSIFDGEHTLTGILWILVGVSALTLPVNYFLDYHIINELLTVVGMTGGTVETVVYGVMGAVAVIALADWFGVYNMADVVEEVLNR